MSELVAAMIECAGEPSEQLSLRTLTRRYARAVLDASGGNKSRAARVLGVSRRALYRLLASEAR
jgi:DNA-binding NtrC family response regulator